MFSLKTFFKAHNLFWFWAFFISTAFAQSPPLTFAESKKLLLKLYQEHPVTFYCECTFSPEGIVESSSEFLPENTPSHLLRLEWEHIVPASKLGRSLTCWDKYQCSVKASSNRECCRKTSLDFNIREADLYNLVPAIKLSNSKRSNYRPGVLKNKKQASRVCKILIDKKRKVFEPDDDIKGFIARTYLLMEQRYHLSLTDNEKELFHQWDVLYPKSQWEIRRQILIDQIYNQ